MRHSRSPSKNGNDSPQCSTPVESVSKWKIPHYYRKSNSGPVKVEASSSYSSRQENAENNGNINIMTTPKHVQLEETGCGKRGSKSKAKKGEMVFVNYTVKDAKPADPPPIKKKSSKSRMLKIFSSVHNSNSQSSSCEDVPSPDAKYSQQNFSDLAFQSRSSASTPSQATKRSYSSFLKCGGMVSASTITSPTTSPSEEVVPSSSAPSRGILQRPPLASSLSSSVSLVNNNGKASLTLGTSEPSLVHRHSPSRERSHTTENLQYDHHYLDQYGEHGGFSTIQRAQASHAQLAPGVKPGDENDASIAFSKMFTRKRANTGGSMSSLVSSTTSHNLPSLHRNMSTNSISSLSNRYSPIRAGSPARNSSTWRAASNRYSRDLSTLHSSSSYATDSAIGMESYLDTQSKQRGANHKKKQESISDLYRIQQNTVFVPDPSTVSSVSSASTPCFVESSHCNSVPGFDGQNSVVFSLDRESSLENEILEEQDESAFSPNEASALKEVVPKTTVDFIGERESDIVSLQNTSRSSGTMFSSLVNSHSTLDSSIPSTKETDIPKAFESSNFPHINSTAQANNPASLNFGGAQNDDFLNLYMELDLGSRAELMTSQPEKPIQGESEMSISNGYAQGDVSTLNSMLNASPATITNSNNIGARSAPQQDSSYNEQVPYTSFSNRIMHDIDQITHSINASDNANELTDEWN